MEGAHSPFGFIWQIAAATGWDVNYILWKIPYPQLLMIMSDSPRYITEEVKKVKGKGKKALDFFQATLEEVKLNNLQNGN
jgi:hypothetical protein